MDAPTATQLRMWAPPAFDFSAYGFPAGADGDEALEVRGLWAVATLWTVCGRALDSITAEEEPVAQKVLIALVLIEVMGGSEKALRVLEAPWLKSFTAGSYSETRFSPSEVAGGGRKQQPFPMGVWMLMWSLMTEEKRAEWMSLLDGTTRPAGVYAAMDFGDGAGDAGPWIDGQGVEAWPV